MTRREILQRALSLPATALAARGDVPTHRWDGYDFGPGPRVTDRLNQGPFGIEQDEGWFTIASSTPSRDAVRNFGHGLVGYTWEEGGPSLDARAGRETLEQHVERMASLPFVDVLYVRCDWRDVQSAPGRLALSPIWKLTLDAAKQRRLRVAFRVQLSNPEFQPKQLAMPDFVASKVPLVDIGKGYREPRYDHPEFRKAFRDLTELLAAEFDGNPIIEFADLMQFGFWGEGHTGNLKNPFPDYLTAERCFLEMTQLQIDSFRRIPLAVNTQPDIGNVGNRAVIDLAVRSGCWLRSDSVLVEEPEQIEALSNRPPWLATIMEDGYFRQYKTSKDYLPVDEAGVNKLQSTMLHTLDLGANYWSLWTESKNLAAYAQQFPKDFAEMRRRLGYRVRPSWVWQRKRYGAAEIIVAFANDGVAGVPGVLRVTLESADGKFRRVGSLDAGHPYAGKLRQAAFVVPSELQGQELFLRAEIETKSQVRRPVQWACAQKLGVHGGFPIRVKSFNDKDWRKNV